MRRKKFKTSINRDCLEKVLKMCPKCLKNVYKMSTTNVHKDCLQKILQKKFTKHCFSNAKRLDLKSKNNVNNIVDKF